ncbi:MAG: DUF3450 domain-containing protein [Gammaproteobacteria bacterium]|nr:DUF3450 domain-containing protein [Gammaproteobacteria bacterium]
MIRKYLVVIPALLFANTVASQQSGDTTDQIVDVGIERMEEGQTAQQSLDTINEDVEKIVNEYFEKAKVVENLEIYNGLLQQQIDNQNSEIKSLKQSIIDAAVIERQMIPMLTRMIDKLEQFVQLDMPFLREERLERVERLRDLLVRADLTLAEKCRRVFEAYQIENEYSRTIESYRGQVTLNSNSIDVEFLRIGRIALVYQDLSGERMGNWNQQARSWQPLTENFYRRHMQKGLKISRQEMAPELFSIPLTVSKEVR